MRACVYVCMYMYVCMYVFISSSFVYNYVIKELPHSEFMFSAFSIVPKIDSEKDQKEEKDSTIHIYTY